MPRGLARVRRAILGNVPSHLGRYELLRPIGRGGMAEVWLARHRGAGGVEKRVVLKRILRERIRDPRFLDLFVGEAQISMALTHKNIVPTFDFGRVGDELFLVMEYIEGTNLALAMREAQRQNARPRAPLLCHIAFEACQALEYAHGYKDSEGIARRIAHRDVTPANLFLSAVGEVKLGDFGLAQVTEIDAEAEGATHGTPRYMAPEQARGGIVGPPADIFALGLILRDCLVFDVLRKGSQEEQLRAAKNPVPAIPETISEEMRAICERATQFLPEDRYSSAKAMSEDLDRALLHARMAEPNDRRPMPERLADWVASLKLEATSEESIAAVKPEGQTVTFRDHGVEEVLAGLGDATMRSMAATGFDLTGSDPTVPGRGNAQETAEPNTTSSTTTNSDEVNVVSEDPNVTNEPRRKRPWLSMVALMVVPLGAIAYLLVGPSSAVHDPMSDAAVPLEAISLNSSVFDAAVALEVSFDGAPVSVDAAPPSPDARTRKPSRSSGAPTPPTETLGTLRISSAPWATVTVIGRSESCAETPCQLKLPIGTYRLELRNPVAGLKKVTNVTVRENDVVKMHAVLEAPRR